MRVESKAVVFDAASQPESERVAFFGGLLRLDNGDLLSGFTTGAAKHHPNSGIRLARSCDGGDTWSVLPWRFVSRIDGVPGSLAGAELVEVKPGRLLVFTTWFDRSEPGRPLFDAATEGILHSKLLVAASGNGGDSWSDWAVVPTPGLTGCAMTGPVLQWPDGTLALAFESFKEYDDPGPSRHAAWLVVSKDGGHSFDRPIRIAHDPDGNVYYWDQRLCPGTRQDQFHAMFWTHDRGAGRDLNVHCLSASLPSSTGDPESASTAAAPRCTSIPGQICAPLQWSDDRLLAFVVDRARPGTLRLWMSRDGGETWPETESLVVHSQEERAALSQGPEDIEFAAYWDDMLKWSFGHPSIRRFDDTRAILVWYAGDPGTLGIYCARVVIDES